LLAKGGPPRERLLDVWLVDASYTNAFLLFETATVLRARDRESPKTGSAPRDEFVSELADTSRASPSRGGWN